MYASGRGVVSGIGAHSAAAPTTRHLSGSPMGPALDLLSLKIIVPAFYVGAGIAFFMGVVAAVLGSIGRRIPLYLAFSLMCFPAAGFIYFSGYYHGSASLAEAAWALRWQSACGFLAVPPFFWFIALYGGQARYGKWLVVVTALFLALAIISLGSPYSLRFTAVTVDEPLWLPWGERISLVSSTPHIVGQILFRGAIFSVWFWALSRCVVVFRSRRRRRAAFLGAYLLLQIGSMVQGALVDFGYLQLFYTAGFAFLALVILMGVSMALDLRDQKFMLEVTLAGLRQEIDRRTRAEDRIHRLAYYDPVTGLPNRAWLNERLQEGLAQSQDSGLCGALILLHLDRFQIINASIGHAVGNELLRSVSRRLAALLPEQCALAKTGALEFTVLASGEADAERAGARMSQIADSVGEAFQGAFFVAERPFYLGASMGISLFPQDGPAPEVLLRKADMALREARAPGPLRSAFFLPRMQEANERRLVLEKGLREGLEEGQLAVHYQPQFDDQGYILGAEALLRWHHPALGAVSPTEFIPVAEECGLIHRLGEWVLDEACGVLKAWPSPRQISVNVSPWDFARPDYPAEVERLLAATGAEATRLVFEIAEGTMLYHAEQAMENAKRLRALGVQIAIDDFGTGYSSLAYLQRLPLDQIKIDKLFVQALDSQGYVPLARVLVDIGREMRLKVIAEGVETEGQLALLRGFGCRVFQGFLFSKAVDKATFLALLAGNAKSLAHPRYGK